MMHGGRGTQQGGGFGPQKSATFTLKWSSGHDESPHGVLTTADAHARAGRVRRSACAIA